MPIRGAQNFIHQETKIFGATNSLFFRNSAGVLTQLPIGTANQQLGIDGGNNLVWLNPATFSLADDSVTFAKMQNITSPAILGRTTAGAGDPESLTPSQLSAMLGLGNAATRTVGLANGNLVEVVGGKIDPILIPAVAMGTVQSVATNAAKLALTGLAAGEAIVRVIADETRGGRPSTYALSALPPATEANWILLTDEQVDGADITSGVIAPSRLGTGVPNSTNFLRGDGSWQSVSGRLPLVSVTANGNLAIDTRYYSNGAARLTLTLPTVAAIGSQIKVTDVSGQLFRIAQNSSQSIRVLDASSTVGTGGFIESMSDSPYGSIMLECIAANNTWLAVDAPLGNFNIV